MKRIEIKFGAMAVILLMTALAAQGMGRRIWTGAGTSNDWSDDGNWRYESLLDNGTVLFGDDFASGTTINVDAPQSVVAIDVSTAENITLANNAITLEEGGVTRAAASSGTQTISSALILGTNGTWNMEGSGRLVVSGVVSGGYGLEKTGAGTLELVAANTFSGSTTVSAGTLVLSGSVAGDMVVSNATLNGAGTVGQNLVVGNAGVMAPGAGGAAVFNVLGDAAFNAGATYEVDVVGGTSSDTLVVGGTLDLGDQAAVLNLNGAINSYLLLASADTIVGEFATYTNGYQVQQSPDYWIHYVTNETPNRIELKNTPPPPTSSGVDLRAFMAAEGVCVEFVAYDVEADGSIMLGLMDDEGRATWQGTVAAEAGPTFFARFIVPGLELGESYDFAVRDEVGKWWQASGVVVGEFAAEMTSLSLTGITITFESLPDHEYEIQWTPNLGAAWETVDIVRAQGVVTHIVVDHPSSTATAGFYRVQLN